MARVVTFAEIVAQVKTMPSYKRLIAQENAALVERMKRMNPFMRALCERKAP